MADNERLPHHHLRAADTDRDSAAAALGEHFATGRLTAAEHDERTSTAWAARTYGDLSALFEDLPPPRWGITVSSGSPANPPPAKRKKTTRARDRFGALNTNVVPILPALIVLSVVAIVIFKGPLPLLLLAGWWWWCGSCRYRTPTSYR